MPARRGRLLRHPTQLVVLGFVAAILVGACLLCLPAASRTSGTPFEEAIFTATSAVTVTGLATVDTATFWTPFGQAVILGLIQLGGLGILTSASLLFLLASKRLGLGARLAAQTETHTHDIGQVRRLLVAIAAFSVAFETVLAAILTGLLLRDGRPFETALWEGSFHAVSSFNNAGFSLYTDGLVGFAADGAFLLTIAAAVIAGGLGFPVWLELARRVRSPARWSLHTKLTLTTTAALLALGTVALCAIEWSNGATLGEASVGERLLGGFFAAVVPRTAGFNALDYGEVEPASLLVTDMLMFAGGGSGSTAGGIKVTTLAVLFLVVWSELRGDARPHGFRRRVPGVAVQQALTIAVLSMTLVTLGALALMVTNGVPMSASLFEAISAFATVGLSTGITPELDLAGQAVLMPLMLIGRVGPVTLFVALVLRERERLYAYPEERPLVG
jgi:trk system potassium uptake protein TrkH